MAFGMATFDGARITLSSISRATRPFEVCDEKTIPCRGVRGPGGAEPCRRPGLSVASDHFHRALRRGRPGRRAGPGLERADARRARPADHHRERRRRQRHHRCRPRGARRAGRLHGEHRQLAVEHHQRRDLQSELRRPEGPRAGRPPAAKSLHRRGAQGPAGEGPQGVHRLAQGQPGQGDGRHRGARLRPAHQRRLFPEDHRREIPVRAVQVGLLRYHPRHHGGAHRFHLRSGDHLAVAYQERQRARAGGDLQPAARSRARDSDGGRSRRAGHLHLDVVRTVGAEGHAAGGDRQARRGGARRRWPTRRCARG